MSETKQAWENLITDSMLLQAVVISVGDGNLNGCEIVIWALVFFYYSSCKVISITAKSRLANNQIGNLKGFSLISAFAAVSFMVFTFKLFYNAGLSMVILINYEGLLVIKESTLILYQLRQNSELSGGYELVLQLLEILINIGRWLHISFRYSDWILTSPIQFFIIMKLQVFIFNLIDLYRRYRNYLYSMKNFVKKYPALSTEETLNYRDEKCCICWEALPTKKCSKISCGHVHHIKCIRTWILNNTDTKCPLCNQVFLRPDVQIDRSILSYLHGILFSRYSRDQRERDLQQIRAILPNLSENAIRRELDRSGSIDETIANLMEQ